MNNITSGFKNTGIWPIYKNIFSDEDFLPAFVTDRPQSLKTPTGSAENSDESSSNEEELPHRSSYLIEPELDSNARTISPSILS